MATQNIEIPLIVLEKKKTTSMWAVLHALCCMTVIRSNRIEAEREIRSSSAKPMILQ